MLKTLRGLLMVTVLLVMPVRATLAEQAATLPATLPAKLEPYRQVVEQCAQYQQLVSGRACQTVFHETFSSPAQKPGWFLIVPQDAEQTPPGERANWTKILQEEGRNVLLLGAPFERQLLAVGPKIKGDFVVEYVGKALSEQLCDLSLLSDGTEGDTGPGFQFGGFWNTINRLCTGPAKDAEGKLEEVHVRLPEGTPLLVRDRWYRVRVEVRSGHIAAYVDGKLMGRAPLASGYSPANERQLMIYSYRSQLKLAEVRISTFSETGQKLDAKEAWGKAFSEVTAEQVREQLTALVRLLDDPQPDVRDAAQDLLWRVGDLASEPLKAAAQEQSAEKQQRAKALLAAVGG